MSIKNNPGKNIACGAQYSDRVMIMDGCLGFLQKPTEPGTSMKQWAFAKPPGTLGQGPPLQ